MSVSQTTNRRGFTIVETVIVLGIIGLVLGACWVAAEAVVRNNGSDPTGNCSPELISTAPDGTQLWKIGYICHKISHEVYFSTHGTSTRVQSGKVSRPEDVPNAQ